MAPGFGCIVLLPRLQGHTPLFLLNFLKLCLCWSIRAFCWHHVWDAQGKSLSLEELQQARLAHTHIHLSDHIDSPITNIQTQQSRKDGLKILVGFWLAGFLSKWFSLLQEPVDPLSPGCLSRRCQSSGVSMATKPQQNLLKSNPSAEMFGAAWWTFPDQLSRYVWVHVATWVKDTISSPQMSTLIFLCSLRHTLLPLTLSPCCAARGRWGGTAGQSDQNGSYLGLGNEHECQRDAYMWLGVESGHTDTLQIQWNEAR